MMDAVWRMLGGVSTPKQVNNEPVDQACATVIDTEWPNSHLRSEKPPSSGHPTGQPTHHTRPLRLSPRIRALSNTIKTLFTATFMSSRTRLTAKARLNVKLPYSPRRTLILHRSFIRKISSMLKTNPALTVWWW